MGNNSSRNKYKYQHIHTKSDDYSDSPSFDSVNPIPHHEHTLRNRKGSRHGKTIPMQMYPTQTVDHSHVEPIVITTMTSEEILVSSIQQLIDMIIDFTIDNYRISYKLEEAVKDGQGQIQINVNELCIMLYNIHKNILQQVYHPDLIANTYDYDNIYINLLKNIIFSTVNNDSKITSILKNQNILSFIEQIQQLLDPYILIYSEDYTYVIILIQ